MKALEINVNGVQRCLAGIEGGTMMAMIGGVPKGETDATHMLTVIGRTAEDEQSAYWLAEPLFIGDEVAIRIVEADSVDPPIQME